MTISKGRDNRVSFVEDYITDLSTTIMQSAQLFDKEIDIVRKTCQKEAEEYGKGDKDVERHVFSSMYNYSNIGVLDEYMTFLRAANFCFIYNTYEKLLKYIISEYNIPYYKIKKEELKSIAFNYVFRIKLFLGIESFENEVENIINRVDSEYRMVRINLTHGERKHITSLAELLKNEPDINISNDEIFFHSDKYILSLLECVEQILTTIVNIVDQKSKEE